MSREERFGLFPKRKGSHPEWHNPNFYLGKLIPASMWRTGSEKEDVTQPQRCVCVCVHKHEKTLLRKYKIQG